MPCAHHAIVGMFFIANSYRTTISSPRYQFLFRAFVCGMVAVATAKRDSDSCSENLSMFLDIKFSLTFVKH